MESWGWWQGMALVLWSIWFVIAVSTEVDYRKFGTAGCLLCHRPRIRRPGFMCEACEPGVVEPPPVGPVTLNPQKKETR